MVPPNRMPKVPSTPASDAVGVEVKEAVSAGPDRRTGNGTADLDQPAIQQLIAAALQRAIQPIDPAAPGQLVIRSISPKQRPRRPK